MMILRLLNLVIDIMRLNGQVWALFNTFYPNLNFVTIYYYKVVLFSKIFVCFTVLLNQTHRHLDNVLILCDLLFFHVIASLRLKL